MCEYTYSRNAELLQWLIIGITILYRIAGFFEDKNFHELAFPRFSRGKFSQIVTDCEENQLKSEHLEGKIFTNCFRFVKFAKNFPLENNPLYGISAFAPVVRTYVAAPILKLAMA